jgi:hypothetical protein
VVPDYRNIEQPQWDLLLAFIHETTERFLPSPSSKMQGNFFAEAFKRAVRCPDPPDKTKGFLQNRATPETAACFAKAANRAHYS